MRCDEPQRPVRTVPYADSGRCQNRYRAQPGILHPDSAGTGNSACIFVQRDPKVARHAAGTGYIRHAPDQDTPRCSVRLRNQVQAAVHTVNQVDVGVAGRTVDNLRARRDSAGGMRGVVVEAQVGFHLGDGRANIPYNQHLAEQVACYGHRVPSVKRLRKHGVGLGSGQRVD